MNESDFFNLFWIYRFCNLGNIFSGSPGADFLLPSLCRSSSTNPIHFPHCVPSLSPPCTPAYLYQALSLSLSFVASLFFLLRTTTQTHGRTHIHSGRRKELGCTARSNYDVASILDTQFSPGFAAAISVPRIRGPFSAPVPEAAHCPSAGSASRDRAAVPCSAGSFQRAGTDHYSVTHTISDPLAKKRRRTIIVTKAHTRPKTMFHTNCSWPAFCSCSCVFRNLTVCVSGTLSSPWSAVIQ